MLDRKNPPSFAKDFSFDLPNPEIITLTNGLQVVWLNNIPQEVIKLDIVYKAAKWHEPKIGVSYFTAHMIEKGTAKLSSKKIAELLDQQGAQLEVSAGADFTSIALYTLSKNFEKVIPVFFDILREPIFPEEEFKLLSDIFLQNLKINQGKNSFVATRALQKNLFGKNHPYGSSIEEEDMNKISISDLVSFFKNSFTPHEVYLTGNLNPLQTSTFLQSLSSLGFKRTFDGEFHSKTTTVSQEKIKKEKSIQSAIHFGKISLKKTHSDYPGLLLVNHILGGYFGSRLMKNIREKKGLTYGIYSSLNARLQASLVTIATDVNIEKIEATITEITKELQLLTTNPIPAEELKTAKNHLLGNLQLEVSNPFSASDKIKHLRLFQLQSSFYTNLFDTIKKLTDKDLQSIAAQQLLPSSFISITVG
jgi:zinc protease